jgi:hypothetical protein
LPVSSVAASRHWYDCGRNMPCAMSSSRVQISLTRPAHLLGDEGALRRSRCRLDAGPIFQAAVWLNRYSKYWQQQFDLLAAVVEDIVKPRMPRSPRRRRRGRRSGRRS